MGDEIPTFFQVLQLLEVYLYSFSNMWKKWQQLFCCSSSIGTVVEVWTGEPIIIEESTDKFVFWDENATYSLM